MKPYSIFLIIAFAAGIVSCKKNNADQFASVKNESGKQLSTWYDNQLKAISVKTMAVLGSDQPDWSQSKFFADQGMYITPVALKENGKAAKFFTAKQAAGSFKEGSYFVFLTKKGALLKNPEQLILNRFNSSKAGNGNFSGAILQYDMNNKLISAAHFKDGVESGTVTVDNIVYKPEKAKIKSEEGPVGNVAPLECGEGVQSFCIDWYWQTYEEGVLVEEEYLYTTCYCLSTGGSNNANINQLIANSVLDPALNVTISNILQSCSYEFETPTTRSVIYHWQCANHPTYKIYSTERGNLILSGNSSPSYKWKFSSIQGVQHLSTSLEGWSLGAEIKQECTWYDVVFSNERYFSTITLELKVTASTTQKGILYEKYTTLHPSKILYANNSQYVLPGY